MTEAERRWWRIKHAVDAAARAAETDETETDVTPLGALTRALLAARAAKREETQNDSDKKPA